MCPKLFLASGTVKHIPNKAGKHYTICISHSFKEHTGIAEIL